MKRFRVIPLIICMGMGSVQAELSLPAMFSDNLILQRDQIVPIWGKAKAESVITLALGDTSWTTTARENGAWRVDLPGMPASAKPRNLTVHSSLDMEKLTFRNVVVGEIWICAGESNMAWPMRSAKDADQEIAAAHYPGIRLFTVTRKAAEQPETDCQGAWSMCSPDSVYLFSATAYYFGRQLHQSLGVPVGLINCAWGGSPAESWVSRPALQAEPALRPLLEAWDDVIRSHHGGTVDTQFQAQLKKWDLVKTRDEAKGHPPPTKPRMMTNPARNHQRPANLYNGMIAPLVPYAIRGVVWHQGEANQSRAHQYRTIFPALIRDWRDAWGTGGFPFYFVQVANYREPQADPGPSSWAEVREAQLLTLKNTPGTGMAVTIDIGVPNSMHYKNKQDVGKRLARWALARTYGKELVPSGPVFKQVVFEEGRAVLTFDLYGSALRSRDEAPLTGFVLAGPDQKFISAQADIKGGEILVTAPGVQAPVAVRYGWADNPDCNLINEVGLPASPFRNDDWPGVTDERVTPF